MCTAIYKNRMLSRTVDRIGSTNEHWVIGNEQYTGDVIRNNHGEIWIDGMNKYGLMIALLNYRKEMTAECVSSEPRMKLHPGRLVQYLLENCRDVANASQAVLSLELTDDAPEMYPHYIVADRDGRCIVFESGRVYENTSGVLTNAPSFPEQIENSKRQTVSESDFYSSESRFSRMVWLSKRVNVERVVDCFDLLTAVTVPEGADDRPGYRTILRSVMSADSMTYSYSTGCSGKINTVSVGSDFEIHVRDAGF